MKRAKHLLLLVALTSMYACDGNPEPKEAPEAGAKTGVDPEVDAGLCVAPPAWFKEVNGTRQTDAPDEGPTSPFANQETVKNCDFHKWSWQKFLWLTNEVNDRPQFLDILIQVTRLGERVDADNSIIQLEETAQASDASDILKTPGDTSNTVYYAMFMDQSMYDTMVKYAPIDKEDPSEVAEVTFPVGALEIKTSWIEASALEDQSTYFITKGEIGGAIVNVALLGMHVVGVVENHPEFIWATFEHDNLGPMYDWDAATHTQDAPVTTSVAYPFFGKDATATVENITSKNGIYTDEFFVYKYGTPVVKDASDAKVFMATSQDGSENFEKISMINESVKDQLGGVWNNYFYNGSIWIDTESAVGAAAQANLLNATDVSDASPGKLVRGSVAAYNITMETYVQVGFGSKGIYETDVKDLASCFLCHSTQGKSPLHFSHVYNGYLGGLNGLSKEQIKQQHVDEVKGRVLARQKKSK